MLCDHGGLVAVQRHGGGVEVLLGVAQLPVKVRHSALEYASEEAGDQGASDTCQKKPGMDKISIKTPKPKCRLFLKIYQ